MDLGLAGKRALVLSSSRGLGRASAEALAAEGADVVLTARSAERLGEVVAAIGARGRGRAHAVVADLKGASGRIHDEAVAALGGPIDILVANTGGPPAGLPTAIGTDAWVPQFEAMVLPVFDLAARVLPAMRERGFGRIVIVASSGIVQPIPNLVISNALRSAIRGWAKTLAEEVARDGITVNMVLPGRIATDRLAELDAMAAERTGKPAAQVAAASQASIPAGRYGRPEEFGNVVCFLASERASYVTGSAIAVDGGAVRGI